MLIQNIILGILVSLSFLLGALLYTWAKEEVDKSYKYLKWLNLGILIAGIITFAILLEPIYLVIVGVLIFPYLGGKLSTKLEYLHIVILGLAFGFGVGLEIYEIISLFFVAYIIILTSYTCKKSNAFKKAGKFMLIFLLFFFIILVINNMFLNEVIAKHVFFWLLAILTPLAFLESFKKT